MKGKHLTISILSILLMILLAACGGSDSSPETDNDTAQEETSAGQENNENEEAYEIEEEVTITAEEASQASEAFLTYLDEGDFDEAEALLDEIMASEISSMELEAIWTQLETEFGEFTGFDYVENQQIEGYYSFIYESTFGDHIVILNLTMNGNTSEVSGFFIRPPE
ncbi:DUF3887 domain-containing protein [Oceanobacillus sp. FSL W7-1293]|uniref:DUF3887 domain-containing protein n=1 Tax=Oceanobacillus sp. FSL W7-1293 TaxID=2921699 RepID=UPI0030CBF8FF